MREEVELLFVKVVLKPVIELEIKIKPKKEEKKDSVDIRQATDLPPILDENEDIKVV